MSLHKESEFFRDIVPKVRKVVNSFKGNASVTQYKSIVGDYATEVDIAVEQLIVKELKKRFPNDQIISEEEYPSVKISKQRIWIIDPICGTTNLGRGLKNFCTNIALADNHTLIASCLIDHSQENYFWSIGNQEVYVNEQFFRPKVTQPRFGIVVDVDLGSLGKVGSTEKKRLSGAILKLSQQPGWMQVSLNTSLGAAYTSIAEFDGFIRVLNHPWDICAASFLIQQSGGIITELDGSPWNILSAGAIGAKNAAIHEKLLQAYGQS